MRGAILREVYISYVLDRIGSSKQDSFISQMYLSLISKAFLHEYLHRRKKTKQTNITFAKLTFSTSQEKGRHKTCVESFIDSGSLTHNGLIRRRTIEL